MPMFNTTTHRDAGGSWFGEVDGVASSRPRGRLVLRGQLDEVGLDNLLGSLGARSKTCFVEVRSAARRGEVTLDRGRIMAARVEGLSEGADVEAALAAMRSFYRAVFDVLSLEETSGAIARTPGPLSSPSPSRGSRPPPPMLEGDATEVALAAAVMNACGVYTRKWLGPKAATSIMSSAWARISATTPALDAFRISPDGMVSVSGVERAKAAIPRAVASWVFAVFEAGAMFNPSRFQRYFVPEMLGGLMRLLDKGGFGEAFREGGVFR